MLINVDQDGSNTMDDKCDKEINFAKAIFNYIFLNEKLCILIQISQILVPRDQSDNKSAMVYAATGDKSLPDPFTDAYTRDQAKRVKVQPFATGYGDSGYLTSSMRA